MPRLAQFDGGNVSLNVPAAMYERLEKVAPTTRGQRSAFVRRAIERALDEAERQAEQDRERATV